MLSLCLAIINVSFTCLLDFSVSFSAPAIQLMFSSHSTKSKAEKFRKHILQAFESVLGSPLTIEIRCEMNKDATAGFHGLLVLPSSRDGPSHMIMDPESNSQNRTHEAGFDDINKRVMRERDSGMHRKSPQAGSSEIVEIPVSPREAKDNRHAAYQELMLASSSGRRKPGELTPSQIIVGSKVSIAHVIHHGDGCTRENRRSNRKAVSIAEKLEQENLYVYICCH